MSTPAGTSTLPTVTVSEPIAQNPAVYPCIVNGNGVSIVVSPETMSLVLADEQGVYVQARALLVAGFDPTATVTPYATGEAGPPDTRNWAALWLDGAIPS